YSALFSLLLLPDARAFPAFWRNDETREVRRTEVMDEVEERTPDFFLDNDPNGLDANEIYDSIMDNPEMEMKERKFFDPVPMVNVFRSSHNPTEMGFNAVPTGARFESIRAAKVRTTKAPSVSVSASLSASLSASATGAPPHSAGFFFGGGAPPPLPLNSTKAFFGAIEGARRPSPPPAPLMIFTRAPAATREVTSLVTAAPQPRRAKKLFWPVWKRNTIIWVRTPPPSTTATSSAVFVWSTTPRPLAPQPRPAFRVTAGPKPVHIQRNRGPTFNCRVLNPELDGKASVRNDWSCKMLFPGIPRDNSCRCLYEVEGRDDHGCATGYVYTCSRVN
ncbi:hypothetical protein PMAYCL1PPCAC_00280, partial [Pristionchus mayeri]